MRGRAEGGGGVWLVGLILRAGAALGGLVPAPPPPGGGCPCHCLVLAWAGCWPGGVAPAPLLGPPPGLVWAGGGGGAAPPSSIPPDLEPWGENVEVTVVAILSACSVLVACLHPLF